MILRAAFSLSPGRCLSNSPLLQATAQQQLCRRSAVTATERQCFLSVCFLSVCFLSVCLSVCFGSSAICLCVVYLCGVSVCFSPSAVYLVYLRAPPPLRKSAPSVASRRDPGLWTRSSCRIRSRSELHHAGGQPARAAGVVPERLPAAEVTARPPLRVAGSTPRCRCHSSSLRAHVMSQRGSPLMWARWERC